MAEECDDLRNGRSNRLSKLSYKYINNVQVRNFDTLPCSESINNASAPALQTSNSLWLRSSMISGMAGLIDSRNSATTTSTNVHVSNFDTLPCSESIANVFAPTSGSQDPRRLIICGMAILIDSRNSATYSTSAMFSSENLIYYLALRVSLMHLHPPYEHPTLYGWGDQWSQEWQV